MPITERVKKDKHTRNSGAIAFQEHIDGKNTLNTKKHALCLLLIIVVSATVYLNSLKNGFVFDDIGLVKDNNVIYSLANIPYTIEHMYRPVRVISYTIDYYFSGLNPLGYHISNIIYHAITSVLVYLVVFRIGLRTGQTPFAPTPNSELRIPLFAALIFASHPVHTDAVTYISGRRDVLSTLFFLLGFYYFLRYRANVKWIYMALAIMSYLLGIFSKEMAVTLPLIFLAYDFYTHFNTRETRLNLVFFKDIGITLKTIFLKYKYLYVPLIVAGIAFSYYAVFILNASRRVNWYGNSVLPNFLTVGRIWINSIKLLFYPVTLNADYSINAFPISRSLLELRSLLSLTVLAIICYGILRLLLKSAIRNPQSGIRPPRRASSGVLNPKIAFCAVWFFVTMLPVSHIIPHHELFAEHYLYLPSFGLCLLIALLIDRALNVQKYKNILYAFPVIAVILCSYRTIERNKDWRDDYALWEKTCETVPDCARARNNLGTVYFEKGMIDKAIPEHKRATEINPMYSKAFANLGADYVRKGMFDDAIAMCKRSIEINLENAPAYNALGASYLSKGMFDEAIEACKRALAINPDYPGAYLNLGSAYLSVGMLDEGISACKKSIELNPNIPEAHSNLGTAFMEKNMLDEAIEEFKKALSLRHNYVKARKNLGIAYKKKGLETEAEREFAIASEGKP
ncbi:MAG TPA: tetratricopeptide repeat protein [Candidatus Brocadiales bacterium]|nr:tetratricopeptide repeat protein [Candidatus Brocadiales bacterium]